MGCRRATCTWALLSTTSRVCLEKAQSRVAS